jgi:hypothetical protein
MRLPPALAAPPRCVPQARAAQHAPHALRANAPLARGATAATRPLGALVPLPAPHRAAAPRPERAIRCILDRAAWSMNVFTGFAVTKAEMIDNVLDLYSRGS